uniref:Uncharacterized protein n=1 Tax=Anopheles arabiensis TaxID=7173 RepID=A0A182IG16_ANOAR
WRKLRSVEKNVGNVVSVLYERKLTLNCANPQRKCILRARQRFGYGFGVFAETDRGRKGGKLFPSFVGAEHLKKKKRKQ